MTIVGKTVTAVFDGRVLHLDSPSDLEPDKRYLITIQSELPSDTEGDAWDILEALTGTLEAPDDWYGILTETFYQAYQRGEEPEDDAWVLDWSEGAGTTKSCIIY